MKPTSEYVDKILSDFKSNKKKSLMLTNRESNLIRVVIANFLADINYQTIMNKKGDDISDYILENLNDIREIYDKVNKLKGE